VAVFQTALTRCVLVPCAVLLLPPVAMGAIGRAGLLPGSARLRVAVEIGIIVASLQTAMPAALAVFPQV
jgi:hypothetical protein